MFTLSQDVSTSPEIREVTWLADSLERRAAEEQWHAQHWAAVQAVLECLVSDAAAEAPRPLFALYALALCKDALCA